MKRFVIVVTTVVLGIIVMFMGASTPGAERVPCTDRSPSVAKAFQ